MLTTLFLLFMFPFDLSWIDPNTSENGTIIFRKVSGVYQEVGQVGPNITVFTDDPAANEGDTFCWTVKAFNEINTSPASNEACATVPISQPPPPAPPIAPSSLTGQALSPQQIRLRWSDNSTDETSFQVERVGGKPVRTDIFLVSANATEFISMGLKKNTNYSHRVRAVKGSLVSAWSNQVSVTTPNK